MRLLSLYLDGHRSVADLEFDAGPFTVLFGKNNAGKTNILESISGVFAPDDERAIRRTHAGRSSSPRGAAVVGLEAGYAFDDAVLAAISSNVSTSWDGRVSFTRDGVILGTPSDHEDIDPDSIDPRTCYDGARDAPGLHVLFFDWRLEDLHKRVEAAVATLAGSEASRVRGGSPWLETTRTSKDQYAYLVPLSLTQRVLQLASLASDLLPDFVDGWIQVHVTDSTLWDTTPKVLLEYHQRGLTRCADLVDAAGQGAARWMSAAVQMALHLMGEYPDLMTLRELPPGDLSGHVLLIDEPEAHLHPSAVASMVRWCHRMVRHGFTIIAASHHEEFLRAAGDGVTLVHVTRDADLVDSSARALPTAATLRLQELAVDIGMHPAAALSLHRAILFVAGPLDEAVLDEYGGTQLDAAGVKIIPIHRTRNLEGLVAAGVVTELGIKIGVLTDSTDVATIAEGSGQGGSSEGWHIHRAMQIASDKRLPVPTVFSVPEEDLLFALPPDAIREYLNGPFPGWEELVAECREALGASPSEAVDWKTYAVDHYHLPVGSPDGVRDLVRKLDLAGAELSSISLVIKEVVAWAASLPPVI